MPASIRRGFARSAIDGTKPAAGLGLDLGDGQGRTLMAGAWNSAVYEPLAAAARDEDARCDKNRMSGLWSPSQPLWSHLEAAGARTLLFTGVNTDQCVLGTLADAYNAGWDCVLVEDCAATTTESGREVCLFNVRWVFFSLFFFFFFFFSFFFFCFSITIPFFALIPWWSSAGYIGGRESVDAERMG